MKGRGFTLVELLSVIVILAIILTIAVPNVMKIIKKSKTDSYERQKELVISAAKTYVLTNEEVLPIAGETATITLQELIAAQLISEPVKDQRTNKVMEPSTKVVSVTNTGDNKYTFEYIADWPNGVGYIYDEGKYSHMWSVVDRNESTEIIWSYAELAFGTGVGGYQSIEKDHILFRFDVSKTADAGLNDKGILSIGYNDNGLEKYKSRDSVYLGKYNNLNMDYSFEESKGLELMAGGGGGTIIPQPSYPGTGLKVYETTDVIDLEKYNNLNIEYSIRDGIRKQTSGMVSNTMGAPICKLYLAALFGEKVDTGEITFMLGISPDLIDGAGLYISIPEVEAFGDMSPLEIKIHKIWFE